MFGGESIDGSKLCTQNGQICCPSDYLRNTNKNKVNETISFSMSKNNLRLILIAWSRM